MPNVVSGHDCAGSRLQSHFSKVYTVLSLVRDKQCPNKKGLTLYTCGAYPIYHLFLVKILGANLCTF